MKYYVRTGTGDPQILTEGEIFPLIKEGKVTTQTKACPVGAAAWSELGQLLPAFFAPDAKPPEEEGGAMEFVGKAGSFLAEHTGEVASLAQVFARRIFASNFVAEAALPEERAELEKAAIPVKSPMAQNFAAWRRAILWIAGIALSLAALITFIEQFQATFGPNIPPLLRFISVGMHVLNFLAPFLILRAALRWTDIRKSRRGAKFGWLCQFLGPIVLLLLPVKELTTTDDLAANLVESIWKFQKWGIESQMKEADAPKRAELQKQLAEEEKKFRAGEKEQTDKFAKMAAAGKLQVAELEKDKKKKNEINFSDQATLQQYAPAGVYLAGNLVIGASMTMLALVTLLPRVFGMFPGIVRASLTLRTLVPESPLPGYVAALIEPLYGLFILAFVVVAAQLGEGFIFCGLFCLLVSGYLLLRDARKLSKPIDSAGMNAHIKPLRHRMLIATVCGLVLLLVGLWDYFSTWGFWQITSIVCHLVGNIILLTAVGADFLLGLMKFSFDQEKQLRGTPLQADLESRFADLAQVRMAQITDDDIAPAPPTEVKPQ